MGFFVLLLSLLFGRMLIFGVFCCCLFVSFCFVFCLFVCFLIGDIFSVLNSIQYMFNTILSTIKTQIRQGGFVFHH